VAITAPASPGHGARPSGLLAYSVCMRAHGVPDFPEPSGSGGLTGGKEAVIASLRQVSAAKAQAAQSSCLHLLPGGSLSGQPVYKITAQDQQDYLKAVACLRAHGFPAFPDPNFAGGTVSFSVPPSIDTNSAEFVQARQTCSKFIPAGLPYSRPGH
jgi:hypothetical protein